MMGSTVPALDCPSFSRPFSFLFTVRATCGKTANGGRAEWSPSPRCGVEVVAVDRRGDGLSFTRPQRLLEMAVAEGSVAVPLVATDAWPGPGTFGLVAGR